MSDLTSHTRDDLPEYPSDSPQPADLHLTPLAANVVRGAGDPHLATDCPECGNGTRCSPALCNRRRELHARLAESVRVLDGASNVIDMAAARRSRR